MKQKRQQTAYPDLSIMEHDACGIGAVVSVNGIKDHDTLDKALHIVENLEHRAGKDASGTVGDGVGILSQIPHRLFKRVTGELGIDIGGERDYGIGMFFFPTDAVKRNFSKKMFEIIAEKNGVSVLGWRNVPIHPEILGQAAVDCMPFISQCFLKRPENVERGLEFDRRLYILRREFEQSNDETFVVSCSSRTIVYKGMFLVGQLRRFYEDLQDSEFETAIAMVHSRFSTNTTPSWERAHPYRFILHNGEINTIRGNVDRMLAREETMCEGRLGDDIEKVLPVIRQSGSDSAMLDNTLEFLYMSGMDLPLAVMITIPEPWRHMEYMDREKQDFYHYYATMMEPWDGPASILFSDGDIMGAVLDRNGLRPSRYYVTDDGHLILSSEVGAVEIPEEHIVRKSRLMPGKMLLIDTVQKRMISDEECKEYYSTRHPYGEWLDMNLLHLSDLPVPNKKVEVHDQKTRDRLYKAFGYTYEDVKDSIIPMAKNGAEPTASMGIDIPLAVLSEKHQSLFNYFKQMFAQVTNPPIDSLREKVVTDTTVFIGSDGNLLKEEAANCTELEVHNPILTGVDLLKIKALNRPGFRSKTVSLLYYKYTPLERALQQLAIKVDSAYREGCNIIILSDRGVDENHLAIPSLLAVSSIEHHLVSTKKRTAVSIIIESAEPRDVHQFAMLLGYGARAVNPYLAHECIEEVIERGMLDKEPHIAVDDYNRAILDGIVKIASKMGISTLQSYQSAQIFEAVGIRQDVIDKYFTNTISRVGGIGLDEINESVIYLHNQAFDPLSLGLDQTLESYGFHKRRAGSDKEDHLYDPAVILGLQKAARSGSYESFKEYTALVDAADRPHTLRGLLDFVFPENGSIDISEVEPASEIVKRFKTGAMSYGSISKEAHECMAIAMNRLGGKSNSGEGGEDPERFGTERNSAIKQIASGRFGVTSEYLNSAKEIQIKLAQGAKPGEGGHLPASKVYPWIADCRYSTPGVALISPPPHHDIYSIEDLAQLIFDCKNANRNARISVKLVSEAGVGTIASGVAKAGAQVILISGHDGGTGAAPRNSIHHAGLPWELGVAEAHQSLIDSGLRSRVVIETDGKLMSGRDVAIAALLGAEEFGFATAPLVTMGCMMMRVCNLDTCPAGIATQNETLRRRFDGKPEYVMNFMLFVAEELREIMAKMGFRTVDEMVGRCDLLKKRDKSKTKRALSVSMDRIIDPSYAFAKKRHFEAEDVYDFELEKTVDCRILLPRFKSAIKKNLRHTEAVTVSSTDRAFGTLLGSEITRVRGTGTAEDTFTVNCTGSGGQSFGAFIPSGLTLRLEGDANDYFGKGLSGGKLVVRPSGKSHIKSNENIIIGNVALYGATAGKAYVCGIAGERFCVRNSGAVAVAEGCGDHGLEYMTGGRAVILGQTGKNLAAGMSGGIAYVLDEDHSLYKRINKEMISMSTVSEKQDVTELHDIISDYYKETGSETAGRILADFQGFLPSFKKIIPKDYRKMLHTIAEFEEKGMKHDDAVLEAFLSIRKGGR
ncbi:MAG: glutamate synthase large subunit [Eubacteriales bacterium]|nr:glutamate synthase large subunit [Eubacteriales bacterium]